MPKEPKKKSEYSHTIYSNTISRGKSKHMERHRALQTQLKEARQANWSQEQIQKNKKKKKKRNDGFNVV